MRSLCQPVGAFAAQRSGVIVVILILRGLRHY
jgi:hypothetical protein